MMKNNEKTLFLLVVLILLCFLNGCGKETKLDQLIQKNGDSALSRETSLIKYINYEVIKSSSSNVYENKEIIWENNGQNYHPDKLVIILDSLVEYSSRIVFSNLENGRKILEII